MHKVGTRVHTAHGDGEVTEVETVRGRTEYRVAGRGFNVYIEASKLQVASGHHAGLNDTIDPGRPYEVNRNNSTTLPYDYTPQHHVDMFAGEQTIQPGDYEIDPDERLHASDSLTGEQRKDNRPYPGPNPDLFAKSSAFEDTDPERPEWGDDEWHEGLPDGPERTLDARMHEDPAHPQYGVGSPGLTHPAELEYDDPGNPDSIATLKRQEGTNYSPGEGRHYRPAGLSDRYAHIFEADDHSEVGQFRADPVGYLQRYAHVMATGEEDSLIEKFADYTNLLDSDEHMRTAAWKDVAAKAKRLRADGAVHPEDIGPNRIMATVDGDNATYRTLVLRGPGYAGIGKGPNSATFSCTCSWGKWAFKRQFTFVGRMCSHALATLWELQSHTSKGNSGKFKSAGVTDEFKKWADDNNDGHMDQGAIQDFLNTKDEDFTREDVDKLYDYLQDHHQQAPERDYDIPYTLDNEKAYKTSEILRTRPMSLTPDLREVPKNDEHEWTDVTEDDRKTTGPDQIVHFQASITAALHRTADDTIPQYQTNTRGQRVQVNPNDHYWDQAAPVPMDTSSPSLPKNTRGQTLPNPNYQAPQKFDQAPGVSGGGGDPISPLSPLGDPSSLLHPPAANAAGATNVNAPAPVPVGGPAAPGNPAATPISQDPRETGTGLSSPNDPNGALPNAIGQGSTYHVNQGDTLSDIAQRAGLGKDQYQQIADVNKDLIKDPNHIETGWDIKIPGQGGGSSSPDATQAAGGTKPVDPGSPADMNTPQAGDDLTSAIGGTKPIAPGSPAAPDASTPPAGAPVVPKPPSTPSAAPPSGGANPFSSVSPNYNPTSDSSVDHNNYGPGNPYKASHRYAEASDAALLDKLRQKSVEPASDDLQHMDSRNDEIRDLVDELNDRGLDASFMVASLHYADNPADGDANFFGKSYPNWADESFQGSGPDPRHYISDSQSYLDDHEPDLHDVTEGDDIIKFNDSRSKPQQGPRHTSRRRRYADDDDAGMDAPAWEHADFYGRGDEDHYDDDDSGKKGDQGGGPSGANPLGGFGGEGGAGGAGAEEGVGAAALEDAPELLALAASVRRRGGPRRAPRIDPGVRGRRSELQHSAGTMPENQDTNSLGSIEEPDLLADSGASNDIVANFQRSAAAQDLWSGESSNSGGMFSDDAIAANAQSMLKTAGRKFTQQEQRELEEEAHILGARNLPNDDDLAGTHYLMGI